MELSLADADRFKSVSLKEAREELERELILRMLAKHNGNMTRTAAELSVSRPTSTSSWKSSASAKKIGPRDSPRLQTPVVEARALHLAAVEEPFEIEERSGLFPHHARDLRRTQAS